MILIVYNVVFEGIYFLEIIEILKFGKFFFKDVSSFILFSIIGKSRMSRFVSRKTNDFVSEFRKGFMYFRNINENI